ncbi:MAG: hypothetical protein J5529_12690 [Prevotella sp.]|nr:hypothetical protein [Prevotella sp.]
MPGATKHRDARCANLPLVDFALLGERMDIKSTPTDAPTSWGVCCIGFINSHSLVFISFSYDDIDRQMVENHILDG